MKNLKKMYEKNVEFNFRKSQEKIGRINDESAFFFNR